jgi:hypothetical protein
MYDFERDLIRFVLQHMFIIDRCKLDLKNNSKATTIHAFVYIDDESVR